MAEKKQPRILGYVTKNHDREVYRLVFNGRNDLTIEKLNGKDALGQEVWITSECPTLYKLFIIHVEGGELPYGVQVTLVRMPQ